MWFSPYFSPERCNTVALSKKAGGRFSYLLATVDIMRSFAVSIMHYAVVTSTIRLRFDSTAVRLLSKSH